MENAYDFRDHEISWKEMHFFRVSGYSDRDHVHAKFGYRGGKPAWEDLTPQGREHYGVEDPREIDRRKKQESTSNSSSGFFAEMAKGYREREEELRLRREKEDEFRRQRQQEEQNRYLEQQEYLERQRRFAEEQKRAQMMAYQAAARRRQEIENKEADESLAAALAISSIERELGDSFALGKEAHSNVINIGNNPKAIEVKTKTEPLWVKIILTIIPILFEWWIIKVILYIYAMIFKLIIRFPKVVRFPHYSFIRW